MQSKRGWLFPVIALIELFIIAYLAPKNCAPDMGQEKPPVVERQNTTPTTNDSIREQPARNFPNAKQECAKDDDCPADSSCLNGACVITHPMKDEEVEEDTDAGTDNEGAQKTVRYCVGDDDCGCGYQCNNDQCQKMTEPFCCASVECKEDEFCYFGEHGRDINGICTPSECDTSENCDGCGKVCYHHICYQAYCCTDADCKNGQRCAPYYSESMDELHCVVPECTSDTDCGCGEVCDTEHYSCTTPNASHPPIRCCGTDFFYNGECVAHELIENGGCLDDSHCPAGQVCYAQDVCMPATCKVNADCGCEAVCRNGGCEYGCDTDSDCCADPTYPKCDRGDCVNSE